MLIKFLPFFLSKLRNSLIFDFPVGSRYCLVTNLLELFELTEFSMGSDSDKLDILNPYGICFGHVYGCKYNFCFVYPNKIG